MEIKDSVRDTSARVQRKCEVFGQIGSSQTRFREILSLAAHFSIVGLIGGTFPRCSVSDPDIFGSVATSPECYHQLHEASSGHTVVRPCVQGMISACQRTVRCSQTHVQQNLKNTPLWWQWISVSMNTKISTPHRV
mmetsp:Transcript_3531/g.13507  ORF Transcript_3531/g.13507 Transcript_3531/m.13507 type:complete len:136 (+) Transcript_3531:196-603(+)